MQSHDNFTSCLEKQKVIEDFFVDCATLDEKYQRIIALGKKQPRLPSSLKTPDCLVHGCQSQMYLHAALVEGKMRFQADSEALISSGLASLLILVYDNELPEVVVKCPPTFLEKLNIPATLTPGRANGLFSLHLKMKQEAIKQMTLSSLH